MTAKELNDRKAWTHDFVLSCCMVVDKQLCSLNYHQAALMVANQGKQIIEETIGCENMVHTIIQVNIAKHLRNLHRWEEAQAVYSYSPIEHEIFLFNGTNRYKESTRLMEKQVGPAIQDAKHQHTNLLSMADKFKQGGQLQEAEASYLEALSIIEKKSGRRSLEAYFPLGSLAQVYETQNRLEDAEAMLKECMQIKIDMYGCDSLEVASVVQNLSSLRIKQNRPSDAEAALREGMRIQELRRGSYSEPVARLLNSLGQLYETHGSIDAAEPMYKDALRIFEMRVGRDSVEVVMTLGYLGSLYATPLTHTLFLVPILWRQTGTRKPTGLPRRKFIIQTR